MTCCGWVVVRLCGSGLSIELGWGVVHLSVSVMWRLHVALTLSVGVVVVVVGAEEGCGVDGVVGLEDAVVLMVAVKGLLLRMVLMVVDVVTRPFFDMSYYSDQIRVSCKMGVHCDGSPGKIVKSPHKKTHFSISMSIRSCQS